MAKQKEGKAPQKKDYTLYFVGKGVLDAIDSRRKYTAQLTTYNLDRKLKSDSELMERLDRNYNNELKTQALLGIIIDKSNKKDYWLVLWTQNGVYRIQEHLEYALIDLATCAEKDLKIRKCTSM